MNKQELIAQVANVSGLAKGDAIRAVEAVFDTISASLKKGDEGRQARNLRSDYCGESAEQNACNNLGIIRYTTGIRINIDS